MFPNRRTSSITEAVSRAVMFSEGLRAVQLGQTGALDLVG